jgi:hypothetical protein
MHEMSSLARTLGSWVRILLKAWMFGVCMRLFCVCVVLCLAPCDGLITRPRSPTVCEEMIMELNKRPGPWMGWKSHWKKMLLLIRASTFWLPRGPPSHNCKSSPVYQYHIAESQSGKEASKCKVFCVLNTSWRCMGEWRHRSMHS